MRGENGQAEQNNSLVLSSNDEEINETSLLSDSRLINVAGCINFKEDDKDQNIIRFVLTNARSLSPKIMSLIDYFDECKLHFSIITESWLANGETLDRDIIDLENGTDLKVIYKNRPVKPTSRRRTAGGGVAIVFNKNTCNLKEFKVQSNRFELVCAHGKVGNCIVPRFS